MDKLLYGITVTWYKNHLRVIIWKDDGVEIFSLLEYNIYINKYYINNTSYTVSHPHSIYDMINYLILRITICIYVIQNLHFLLLIVDKTIF